MKVTLLAHEPGVYDMVNAAFQPGYNGNVWVDHPDYISYHHQVTSS